MSSQDDEGSESEGSAQLHLLLFLGQRPEIKYSEVIRSQRWLFTSPGWDFLPRHPGQYQAGHRRARG